MDVEIPLRYFADEHVADLKSLFLNQRMDHSLGIISTTHLQQNSKKLSEVFEDENVIEVLVLSGRLAIADGRHLRNVIAQIEEKNPDPNGPHGWEQRYITVASIYRKEG